MWSATSDTLTSIAPALTVALGELTDVHKGREAKIPTKSGASYAYKYADLADALQMVRPILAKNGLAVMQNATNAGDDILISTTIMHKSGEFLTFAPIAMPAGRTAQEAGSSITYGRRYHLLACLGLAADDDDGASAGVRAPAESRETRRDAHAGGSAPKKAPDTRSPRTPAEKAIRDRLAGLDPTIASNVKTEFIAQFGTLAKLDTDRHDEALDWLETHLAILDEADNEWVAAARGDDE